MVIQAQNEETKIKKALILSGGGMRVAYQAGAILAFEEAGLEFSQVDGTSGGIFNTAMLASGLTPETIIQKWQTLNLKDFISTGKFKEYLKPGRLKGWGDADNIEKKVFPHFGIEMDRINTKGNRFSFTVCNFSLKAAEAIEAHEVSKPHLMAGVSLPILMPALKVGANWYIDAVWIKDANLMTAVRKGAEELWVVWGIGNYPCYFKGSFLQYVHSIEMSANGALWEEFEQIRLVNEMVKNGNSPYGQTQMIKVFLVKPSQPLPLDPDLFFNKINTRELANMGYQDGKSYLLNHPQQGEDLNYSLTQTKDPGDYLCIRGQYESVLPWEGQDTHVIYYSYLRCCKQEGERLTLDLYSSIFISKLNREFKVFLYRLKSKKVEGKWLMEAYGELQVEGKILQIRSEWSVSGPLQIMLGLELKEVKLRVQSNNDGDRASVLEGTVYQSFLNRLKALINPLARKKDGRRGGLKFKFQLIKLLTQHEI